MIINMDITLFPASRECANEYVLRAREISRVAYSEQKIKQAHRFDYNHTENVDPNGSIDQDDNEAAEAKKIEDKLRAMNNINIDLSLMKYLLYKMHWNLVLMKVE